MNTIKRALVSVSDKTGLPKFCQGLASLDVKIVSTGGTAELLKKHGIPVMQISELTGFPEMLDGRVKTLHPKVHGGILSVRDNPKHQVHMKIHGIRPIDMVVVNLYPFEKTVADPQCVLELAIENIDIGGPSMLRSAAKNYRFVSAVTDPEDYDRILEEMRLNCGAMSESTNAYLARKAFTRTAAYDAAISNWLCSLDENGTPDLFPSSVTLQFRKSQEMRYGENPHQRAAFYVQPKASGSVVAGAKQLQGKELSFNNINDANGALELVKEFSEAAVVIVKHTNPCGVAQNPDILEAYRRARAADPVSAFGGIIACNREITGAVAREISSTFVEAVIAPGFDAEALEVLGAKKNLRLLQLSGTVGPDEAVPPGLEGFDFKRVAGGLLIQEADRHVLDPASLRLVTRREPTPEELQDLLFAWKVTKHVKSNAIVYARECCTVGVGAGQMSRVDASRIAVWKAQEIAREAGRTDNPVLGSVLASDAFFPFRDGVDAAAEAGAKAIIQPGGSVRDEEVILAADSHGMAMVFTGVRHFRH
ncbi:MAG: bifunctional phosphoribosylaminoimidazolecarboxamide formyltransferase/IMP cyclohydrolase [Magnetococcales bacterium]|nr:bifunctional phosphoribosylaminoimidazolecarboxamide formyltransferase/IMP cyclohydrolase [Magnetococcales bacterium]